MKKNIILSLLAIIIATFINGNVSAAPKKKIKVGTNAEYAPFEYIDEKGKIVGFDIDFSTAVLKKAGYDIEIVDMGFDGLIPALAVGQIDMIAAGMVSNEERAKKISFSDPYYTSGGIVAVPYDNNTIKGIGDLEGKKIGVEIGNTVVERAKKIKGATVVEVSASEVYLLLVNKKVDAVLASPTPTKDYISKTNKKIKIVGEMFDEDKLAFGIGLKDKKLLNDVNKVLKELKANGEYEKLVKKWIEK